MYLEKHPEISPDNLLLIYDNATAHVESFSGWWCRQMPGIKLTLPPYSPEFNPIERLFRSMKMTYPDAYENETL